MYQDKNKDIKRFKSKLIDKNIELSFRQEYFSFETGVVPMKYSLILQPHNTKNGLCYATVKYTSTSRRNNKVFENHISKDLSDFNDNLMFFSFTHKFGSGGNNFIQN
jgi:hypothetical protein